MMIPKKLFLFLTILSISFGTRVAFSQSGTVETFSPIPCRVLYSHPEAIKVPTIIGDLEELGYHPYGVFFTRDLDEHALEENSRYVLRIERTKIHDNKLFFEEEITATLYEMNIWNGHAKFGLVEKTSDKFKTYVFFRLSDGERLAIQNERGDVLGELIEEFPECTN